VTIAIVDYGVGNLRSVERALVHAGAQPLVTSDPDELDRASGLVLPGVGAFAPALSRLERGGLGRRVVELARKGVPLLGVCLGYQLLFEESLEHGRHQGLGLLEGRVVEVQSSRRLPVIGWCRLRQTEWSPLWQGVPDDGYFYFVHARRRALGDRLFGALARGRGGARQRDGDAVPSGEERCRRPHRLRELPRDLRRRLRWATWRSKA
jgi:glutamine amidotransferase